MGSSSVWNDVWSFASMECVRSWSSGIFQRWIRRWATGLSSVWGDVWSFAVTEYVWSCDSGIFRSWWLKVVSPYIGMQNAKATKTPLIKGCNPSENEEVVDPKL